MDFFIECSNEHDYHKDELLGRMFLSLISNSCAYQDANRERIIVKFDLSFLVNSLIEGTLTDIAIPVLCNICCDYEPAEKLARKHKLLPSIIAMFDRNRQSFGFELMDRVCHLLSFAIYEIEVDDLPDNAIKVIHEMLQKKPLDFDEVITLHETILRLMEYERFRKLLIERDEVSLLSLLLYNSYNLNCEDVPINNETGLPCFDRQQQETVDSVQLALSARLYDLSERAEFPAKHPPRSEFMRTLYSWLVLKKKTLQICACSVLRNCVSSEKGATSFLRAPDFNIRLCQLTILLRGSDDPQVVHECLRLLGNLATPKTNKELLMHDQKLLNAMFQHCSSTAPQPLRYAIIHTLRLLIIDSPGNISHLLGAPNDTNEPTLSYFSRLLTCYFADDDLSVRMEIGRFVVAIWRAAAKGESSYVSSLTDEALRQSHAMDLNLVKAICALITDSGNRALVTEGWFGLCQMSNTPEGLDLVSDYLCDPEIFPTFQSIVRAQEEESTDSANVMVLRAKLAWHYARVQNGAKDGARDGEKVELLGELFGGVNVSKYGGVSFGPLHGSHSALRE